MTRTAFNAIFGAATVLALAVSAGFVGAQQPQNFDTVDIKILSAQGHVSAPRPSRQGTSLAEWEGRGVPYGARTTMTEHYDVLTEADGSQWLLVGAIVEDPQYLLRSFVRTRPRLSVRRADAL